MLFQCVDVNNGHDGERNGTVPFTVGSGAWSCGPEKEKVGEKKLQQPTQG